MKKPRLVLNTAPYRIVRSHDGRLMDLRNTKEEAEAECLRLNRTHCKMMPDGYYDHDRITYVVESRPEYIEV